MDIAVVIGLGVIVVGLVVVRLTIFGHNASLQTDGRRLPHTVPAAAATSTAAGDVAVSARRSARTGDVKVSLVTRVRSMLLLVLLMAGAGAALATLVGLALLVVGIVLWG